MLDKYRNYVGRRAPRDPHLDTDLDREEKYFIGHLNLFIYFILFYFVIVIVYYVGINDTCVNYLLVFYFSPSFSFLPFPPVIPSLTFKIFCLRIKLFLYL